MLARIVRSCTHRAPVIAPLSTDARSRLQPSRAHCSDGPMRPSPILSGVGVALGDHPEANRHAFTRAELLARWPRSRLDRELRDGAVTRILPGVYCGGLHARDPVVMGESVNLWAPSGLVTGSLALHLYAPSLPAPSSLDVLVPHGTHLRTPAWVRAHQAGLPRASGAVQGVQCVVPERALLDAWSFTSRSARTSLLYEALWARACTWRQLTTELRRAQQVPGRRQLERTLAWFAKGATSPLEVRARRDVFTGRRFADFEWQARLSIGPRTAVADMLHRATKVVVELDGARYHDVPGSWRADRARDVDLAAGGYVTVRFGWDEIVRRPEWCRARLSEVVASRGGAL